MTVSGKETVATRPRDASMSLLNNVFAQPIDPGYAKAAAKRREAGEDAPEGPKRSLSLALMAGMLGLGLLLSVAILQAQGSAGVVSAERAGLVERIRAQEETTTRLKESLAELQATIAELEDSRLRSSAAGQRVREELQLLQSAAGTVAVAGPGVSVVLDNAERPDAAARPDMARVLDIDLQQVVNGLWAAGAEAISINGQRVSARSAIRTANDVILVNDSPLSPPYHVQAIGDSRTLPNTFAEGPGGEFLRSASSQWGIRYSVRAEESLRIPATSVSLHYAANSGEAS
jgi:uncharacterized protein YlxW (UPF0749 family)